MLPHYPRTPPRLGRILVDDPLYFVTICTFGRGRFLAEESVHRCFMQYCSESYARRGAATGRYVIMPDHIHCFVRLPQGTKLGPWIGLLKQALTMHLRGIGRCPGPVWQRGFFDHVLRSSESYAEKWEYVFNNPIRAGLVAKPEDWPFAGEIVHIDRA